MGRAKKKKLSLSQRVVSVVAPTLPGPIQKFLSSPIVSFLFMIGLVFSLGTGLVFVKWENGFPSLAIDKEKATEAKQRAAAKLEELREDGHGKPLDISGTVQSLMGNEKSDPGFLGSWTGHDQPHGGINTAVSGQGQGTSGGPMPSWNWSSLTNQNSAPDDKKAGPLSRLMKPFESRR